MSKIQNIIRKNIYITLGNIDKKLGRVNPITILAYHGISNDGWRFNIDQTMFEKQIDHLKQQYEICSLSDVQKFLDGKKSITKPIVVITFDDGYENIYSIKKFAKENNIKPTVFILSDTERANRTQMGNYQKFLSNSQVLNLKKDGWEIGCHSATHADFYSLSKSGVIQEVSEAKKMIEKKINNSIHFFAYPRGRYTSDVIDSVKKSNFQLAVSMDDGKISKNTNRYIFPRVGVDVTHSFTEFKFINSPLVILFRKSIKQSFLNKFVSI